MVKRKKYSEDYKQKLVMEIMAGAKVSQIAQRENITAYTLTKWRDKINSGNFSDSHKTEIELRKRIKELESAVGDLALENHIIKKSRQLMAEQIRKERLLKRTSPKISGQ
jgi:transposase-like protein